MLTNRFAEAFRFAHELHRNQQRKGTSIPYISHLMAVAGLVLEHGGTEDQALARPGAPRCARPCGPPCSAS